MAGFSVNIGADVKQLTAGLNTAKQELAKFDTAIKGTTSSVKSVAPGANQAAASITNLGRIVQDAPYGFIGIANNIDPLIESFRRLKVESGSTSAAFKSLGGSLLGGAGLGLAVSVATSLLVVFADRIFKASKESEELKKKQKELQEAISGAFESTAKEATQVGTLVSVLRNETETRERKLATIKELQNISPETFKSLKLEGDAVVGLDNAYKSYLANLENVIAVKILQARLEQLIEQRLKKQGANLLGVDALGSLKQTREQLEGLRQIQREGGIVNPAQVALLEGQIKKTENSLSGLDKRIDEIMKKITDLSKGVKISTGQTKEEDLLKKRLEALEKIKAITKDATALVGLQEAIFDLQVKIAIRDQGKNKLSKQELDQQLKGYQDQLNEAFKNQAIELESIPKVRFSATARLEINDIISKVFTSKEKLILTLGENGVAVKLKTESVDVSDLQGKISKAVGLDKKIPEITIQQVRIKLLGIEKGNFINQVESITNDLNKQIQSTIAQGMTDTFVALGEGFGEALASGDFGEGLKKAAQNILGILGGVMQQIGREIIGAAIKIKLLKETIKNFVISNPALAIIAGVGLVAAGAALKNIKFDGPKFATGGIVTGPVIGQIGEMHRPEVIMPLDRLPQMLRSIGGGGSGETQPVLIFTNEGLYLQMKRGERRANRKF